VTKQELLQHVTDVADEIWETLQNKNSDYTGDDEDALLNFKWSAEFASVELARGVMVRIADKIMRLKALMKPGHEQKVLDESLSDTVRDLIGYLIIFHGIMWPTRYDKVDEGTQEEPKVDNVDKPTAPDWFKNLFMPSTKKNATSRTNGY
jgi:hypothetical protein